jgi:transposase
VEQILAMGLIIERGKQGTDSIAMLTRVRNLSRLELVVETLRLAVDAVVKVAQEWSEEGLPTSWEDKYGKRFVIQRYSGKEWRECETNIGKNGQWLFKRLEDRSAPMGLKDLPAVQILKTV